MDTSVLLPATVLPEADWLGRRSAHERRVRDWTDPHQARAARGEKHPVWDFLMEYYPFRPAWLRRWHPGPDVVLAGEAAKEYLRWPEYAATEAGVAISPERLTPGRRAFAEWLRELLAGMRARPAFFGCHGLHEWAMVYRQSAEERRHARWPLRLAPAELDRFVAGSGVTCTHFDAFRFFTPPARPLNRLQPTREGAPALEQRGCLHANMDLYKWAFKLAPFTPSDLVTDCFAFARRIREVDMRASPYDFGALGFAPIRIETPEGRGEYESRQRAFAAEGEPLRDRLIKLCDRLLTNP